MKYYEANETTFGW